jgi:hypothetical protein
VRYQAEIVLLEGSSFYAGPFTTNTVTNLCQFSTTSAHFEREYGATMRLRLAESNGSYQCDFKSTEGAVLRTITGTTSNSFVTIHWDLSDEKGNACTNNEFDTVFRLTLPDSGRSQTIRGP